MPGGDRTGPQGLGPRTGRGLGNCDPAAEPRLGYGCGSGRGHGWRRWARATGQPGWLRDGEWGVTPPSADETTLLKKQVEQLQAQLAAVQQRLAELGES
ncbi:MAG TPA: DUF5320 domain-containing protein [Anaerolineae bacterium]|nr:DUF5320 domain-containing protein [Anaerolineae bacterium]HQH39386.1 DUF5320 domain-containing protein [Anaerolineae bacterium]